MMHAAPDEQPPDYHTAHFRLVLTTPDGVRRWTSEEMRWAERPDPQEAMRAMMLLMNWASKQLEPWIHGPEAA